MNKPELIALIADNANLSKADAGRALDGFWFDYATNAKNPPRNRALLAYCPDWCDIGYAVVTWNGANFEDEIRGEDIHDYVEKWCLIFEAD